MQNYITLLYISRDILTASEIALLAQSAALASLGRCLHFLSMLYNAINFPRICFRFCRSLAPSGFCDTRSASFWFRGGPCGTFKESEEQFGCQVLRFGASKFSGVLWAQVFDNDTTQGKHHLSSSQKLPRLRDSYVAH